MIESMGDIGIASISDDDARSILEAIYHGHDANNGVNWEVIETYIDMHE